MVFGMFMSILDIQIVSASLQKSRPACRQSSSEVSWVQTAYLIAEVIAIPLSGFLSRALGTRLLFAISAAGFTFASLMCGFTSTIEQMILWRAIQGFLGAGMIPTVFASAYTVFPRSKFHIVGPIIGLVATLAPTIGPTVGGYITDAMSWHWLFFINIVPGIGITIGVLALVDFDRAEFRAARAFRLVGPAASWRASSARWNMCWKRGRATTGSTTPRSRSLPSICVVSAIALFLARADARRSRSSTSATFTDRNFALGCLFSFCVGIGLYGLTYLYPRYLAEVRGYSALMIGETMFVSGVAMFLTAPMVGAADGEGRHALC